MQCQAQGHDVGIMPAEFQGRSVLGQGVQIQAEKIYREFTVDVVKLMFVFPVRFSEVLLINICQVMEIVGAFGVHTFVNDEVPAVLFGCKGFSTVRAQQTKRSSDEIAGGKSLPADLAQVLTITAVIIVDEVMWGTAERTDDVLREGSAISSLHRLDGLSVAPKIVFEEKLPVLFDKGFDTRKFIDFELLVFRRMGILIGPLLKRDISADKVYQPAVLLIKILNYRK